MPRKARLIHKSMVALIIAFDWQVEDFCVPATKIKQF